METIETVPGIGADALPLLAVGPACRSRPSSPPCSTSSRPHRTTSARCSDDYYLADGPDLRDGTTFLLGDLPPHVHPVISSRTARSCRWLGWARGELVEVRATDLRSPPTKLPPTSTTSSAWTSPPNDMHVLFVVLLLVGAGRCVTEKDHAVAGVSVWTR